MHEARCEYSDLEIVCDKGCNLKVKRCEYKNNCYVHLADRLTSQDEKIYEMNAHNREEVTILSEEVNRLQVQVIKLSRKLTRQQKHITKLDSELKRLRPQSVKLCNAFSIQTPPKAPPQWEKSFNMSIPIDQPNILEFGLNSSSAFAQSRHPLNQANPCFKIQILSDCEDNYVGIGIGLTQKGHPIDIAPGQSQGSIGYRLCGTLFYDKCECVTSHACKVNDIIECGVKFPKNRITDVGHSVVVYFSKNGVAFLKKVIRMPLDGLFPTIYMFGVHRDTTMKIHYTC